MPKPASHETLRSQSTARTIWTLGIDPGEHGSATLLDDRSQLIESLTFTKASEHDMVAWFRDRLVIPELQVRAALEKVRSSPQMGVVSSFTFGWNYGLLRGILVSLNIPFVEPIPHRWQKDLGVPVRAKTEKQPQFKQRLRSIAQERWPSIAQEITVQNADSLLIAEWLRLQEVKR